MESTARQGHRGLRLAAGLAAGIAIAYVDSVAFGGEVSPIVIVVLILAATVAAGILWRRRAWLASVAAWAPLPATHLVKHAFGLPDTIQPNTYASILMLAAFSLAVAGIGTGGGLLFRKLAIAVGGDSPS